MVLNQPDQIGPCPEIAMLLEMAESPYYAARREVLTRSAIALANLEGEVARLEKKLEQADRMLEREGRDAYASGMEDGYKEGRRDERNG